MLVFDDNMYKLAKMQETLLKVSANNREENLKKYKDIVMQIDKQAFSSFLEELKSMDNHNQPLEEELSFLEQIKDFYNQLNELQLNFKNVCELCGDNELKLSDLSQINIEYIDNRISVINGYLQNLKNIDDNKDRLQELSDKLIVEEKNRSLLSKRLLNFEEALRNNFKNAEGRVIVNGQLQYISVVSEYKKLGYDFKLLLEDVSVLENLLSQVGKDKTELEEKLEAADISYNANPNSDSKRIFDDINKEYFKVTYSLAMLKILELLSKNYDDYELFKEKREKIIDLIKYRVICLKKLGEHISIDPFARTKIEDQISVLSSLGDNSKMISKIKKEISLLSRRVDEMIHQNEEYKIQLNDTRELVVGTIGIGDIIDSSGITIDEHVSVFEEERVVLDNQIVSIRDVSSQFNMSIVRQKTEGVIKRVNQMVNTISQNLGNDKEVVVPELVIVSSPVVSVDEKINDDIKDTDELKVISSEGNVEMPSGQEVVAVYDSSIFETVDPFVETPLFIDRNDETPELSADVVDKKDENSDVSFELKLEPISDNDELDLSLGTNDYQMDSEMPDAFWVTQGEEIVDKNNTDIVPSFDEQINALLSEEEIVKLKKLVA